MPKKPEFIIFDVNTGFAVEDACNIGADASFVEGATVLTRANITPLGPFTNPPKTPGDSETVGYWTGYGIAVGHYGYTDDPFVGLDSLGNPVLVPIPKFDPWYWDSTRPNGDGTFGGWVDSDGDSSAPPLGEGHFACYGLSDEQKALLVDDGTGGAGGGGDTYSGGSQGGSGQGGGGGGGNNTVVEDTVESAILYPSGKGNGIKSDGPLCALDSVRSCLFQGIYSDSCERFNKITLHGKNGGIVLDEYSNSPATSIMWPAVRGDECGMPTDRIMDIGNADFKFNWVHGFKFVVHGTTGADCGIQPETNNVTDIGTTGLRFKKIWVNEIHFTSGIAAAYWGGSLPTDVKAALDNLATRVYNLENSTDLADHAALTTGVHGL